MTSVDLVELNPKPAPLQGLQKPSESRAWSTSKHPDMGTFPDEGLHACTSSAAFSRAACKPHSLGFNEIQSHRDCRIKSHHNRCSHSSEYHPGKCLGCHLNRIEPWEFPHASGIPEVPRLIHLYCLHTSRVPSAP